MPQQQLHPVTLSRREKDIAALVADGLTNREIAQRLFISERTVESHLEHIREKLAVKSRAQVAAWFVAGSTNGPVVATKQRPSQAWTKRRLAIGLAMLVAVSLAAGLVAIRQRASSPPTPAVLKPVWETKGADHPFNWPGPVAVGAQGAVYVLDRGNHRVQKLSAQGSYLTSWGGYGTDPGQFVTSCIGSCPPVCTGFDPLLNGPCAGLPGSVAADRVGNVWVFDYTGRIQEFDAEGRLQAWWGKRGTKEGELTGPGFLAFDSKGNLVVSDARRIQRFTTDGGYIGQIGSSGTAAGQYLNPGALAIDSHDNVFVIDFGCRVPCIGGRILKFDGLGRNVPWSVASSIDIHGPQVLAIDGHDNLWVLENPAVFVSPSQKLWKFDASGQLLRAWSTRAFHYPFGLAIDSKGNVFITDFPDGVVANDGRLSKLTPL